jgi:hypothetical protein
LLAPAASRFRCFTEKRIKYPTTASTTRGTATPTPIFAPGEKLDDEVSFSAAAFVDDELVPEDVAVMKVDGGEVIEAVTSEAMLCPTLTALGPAVDATEFTLEITLSYLHKLHEARIQPRKDFLVNGTE